MTQGDILIVDDNSTNLFVLRMMLRRLGHEPLEASDGLSGIALAVEHKPQLLFMDLRMPGVDGMTAAERIRHALGQDAPPIVAVTASVTEQQRDACASSGFAGLIAKPVDFDEVADYVTRFMP